MTDVPGAVGGGSAPVPRASCDHLRAVVAAHALPPATAATATAPAATPTSSEIDASFLPLPQPTPLSDLHALMILAAANKAATPARRNGLKSTATVEVHHQIQPTTIERLPF